MVIASGSIEMNKLSEVDQIINELRLRNIDINEINNEKITFLIERETMDKVKRAFEPLKDINGVKNIHLAYFSIEGAEAENPEMSNV